MTKDEALRMAIEIMQRYLKETPLGNQPHMIAHKAEEAIQACKEALEQPTIEQSSLVQEPVHTNGDRTISMKDRNFTSEGNGYIQDNNFDFDAGLRIDGDFVNDERDQYTQMICNALNTTPPSREWVGLSDEEYTEIRLSQERDDIRTSEMLRKVEAKLKEKNHG